MTGIRKLSGLITGHCSREWEDSLCLNSPLQQFKSEIASYMKMGFIFSCALVMAYDAPLWLLMFLNHYIWNKWMNEEEYHWKVREWCGWGGLSPVNGLSVRVWMMFLVKLCHKMFTHNCSPKWWQPRALNFSWPPLSCGQVVEHIKQMYLPPLDPWNKWSAI